MTVAFVLTCLVGIHGQAQPVIGLNCGQEFATQEECLITEQSMGNGVATPFVLAKCVQSPVQRAEEWCAPRNRDERAWRGAESRHRRAAPLAECNRILPGPQ